MNVEECEADDGRTVSIPKYTHKQLKSSSFPIWSREEQCFCQYDAKQVPGENIVYEREDPAKTVSTYTLTGL